MYHTVVGIQHAFMHHFRQGWVWEYRVYQVFFGGFHLPANHIPLYQLSHFGPNHMRAQQLTGKHGLGNWLYRHALSRPPTAGELNVLKDVLGTRPDPAVVEDLLWLVFMQPEFQMIR